MSLDFYIEETRPITVFDANMTHNVSRMWRKAGIYDALYKSQGRIAGDVVRELRVGLQKMLDNREEYEKLNPENGWGSYASAINFLRDVIIGCEDNPKGTVVISA